MPSPPHSSGCRGSIRGCFWALGRFLLLRAAAARFRRERTRLDRKNTQSVRSMRVYSQVSMRAMPRMSSGSMRVQAHACMSMQACAHVARRRLSFEENIIAWTEGIRDQCAACACTHRRMRACACTQCSACRAAECACNRRCACMHVDARMRACRAAAARFRRESTRLDRRNT